MSAQPETLDDSWENVLSRFQKVRRHGVAASQADALCPAHDDRHRSLSLTVGKYQIALHCHAGCLEDEVLTAARLTRRDLYFAGDDGKLEPRDERAWEKALANEKLVWKYVWKFLGPGLIVGRGQTYKAPYELHNQMNHGFKSKTEVAEELFQDAMQAMYRACCFHNEAGASISYYSAPIIGRALVEAVHREIPENGRGKGLLRADGGRSQPDVFGDPTGDLAAEMVDSEREGLRNDTSPIFYKLRRDAHSKASEAKEAKAKKASPKAGHVVKKLRKLQTQVEIPPELRGDAAEAADTIQWLQRHGEQAARLRDLIAQARREARKPGVSEDRRQKLESAIRAGYRELDRLRRL
jgi:hypothetical protein